MGNVVEELGTAGKKIQLGDLWNGYTYEFLSGFSLWKSEHLKSYQVIEKKDHTDVRMRVTSEEHLNAQTLSVEAGLYTSLGLLNLKGSAKYLNKGKTSRDQKTFAVTATVQSQVRKMPNEFFRRIDFEEYLDLEGATHFVSEVIEGGSASMIFVSNGLSTEKENELKAKIDVSIIKGGEAGITLTDNEKRDFSSIYVEFNGDYPLCEDIGDFENALKEARQFSNRLAGICETISVKLLPISIADLKAKNIYRRLPEAIVLKTQNILDRINEDNSDLELLKNEATDDDSLSLFPTFVRQVTQFYEIFQRNKQEYTARLKELLPDLKKGSDNSRDVLLVNKNKEAENMSRIIKTFIQKKKQQLTYMRTYLKKLQNKGFIRHSSILLDANDEGLEKKVFLLNVSFMKEDKEDEQLLRDLDIGGNRGPIENNYLWWEDGTVLKNIEQAIQIAASNNLINKKCEFWMSIKNEHFNDDAEERADRQETDNLLYTNQGLRWIGWKEVPIVAGLEYTNKAMREISLRWDNIDISDGYVLIAYKWAENDRVPLEHRHLTETNCTLTDLKPKTKYSFQVIAHSDIYGAGKTCKEIEVITEDEPKLVWRIYNAIKDKTKNVYEGLLISVWNYFAQNNDV